jgi:hypothetical protein
LSLSLGAFSLFLFATTGQPLPRAFLPADDLAFRPAGYSNVPDRHGRPVLLGTFSDRRVLLAVAPHEFADQKVYEVFDTASLQGLGSFRAKEFDALTAKTACILTPDHQFLVAAGPWHLDFFHIQTGTRKRCQIEAPWPTNEPARASPDIFPATVPGKGGQELLIYSTRCAFHYDLMAQRTIGAFKVPENAIILCCYFDSRGHPKVLLNLYLGMLEVWGDLEVWDLASNRKERILRKADLGIPWPSLRNEPDFWHISSGASVFVLGFEESSSMSVRSLEDDRPPKTISVPRASFHFLECSADGRYLACYYGRSNPLVSIVESRHRGLERWLRERFPDQYGITLCDLQTGRSWSNFKAPALASGNGIAFGEDSTSLIILTAEGRFVYDVPPRWRYFSPWACVAFGAWLAMMAAWWRLRERRPGPSTVS